MGYYRGRLLGEKSGEKSSYNKLTLIVSQCGVGPALEKAGAKLLLSRGVPGACRVIPVWAAGHAQ